MIRLEKSLSFYSTRSNRIPSEESPVGERVFGLSAQEPLSVYPHVDPLNVSGSLEALTELPERPQTARLTEPVEKILVLPRSDEGEQKIAELKLKGVNEVRCVVGRNTIVPPSALSSYVYHPMAETVRMSPVDLKELQLADWERFRLETRGELVVLANSWGGLELNDIPSTSLHLLGRIVIALRNLGLREPHQFFANGLLDKHLARCFNMEFEELYVDIRTLVNSGVKKINVFLGVYERIVALLRRESARIFDMQFLLSDPLLTKDTLIRMGLRAHRFCLSPRTRETLRLYDVIA